MSSSEGMLRLIDQIAQINGGTTVAGEGLNEVTAPGLSFAQAHLFNSWQEPMPLEERVGGCPVNALLFDGLARAFGYSGLSGRTEREQKRMRVHHSLGAIPTFTGLRPEEIAAPNPAIRELLAQATA
jgi:hypothetical protein